MTVVAGSDVHFGCEATLVSNREALTTSQTRLNKKARTRRALLFNWRAREGGAVKKLHCNFRRNARKAVLGGPEIRTGAE